MGRFFSVICFLIAQRAQSFGTKGAKLSDIESGWLGDWETWWWGGFFLLSVFGCTNGTKFWHKGRKVIGYFISVIGYGFPPARERQLGWGSVFSHYCNGALRHYCDGALRHFDKLSAGVAQCDMLLLIVFLDTTAMVHFDTTAMVHFDTSINSVQAKLSVTLRQAQGDIVVFNCVY